MDRLIPIFYLNETGLPVLGTIPVKWLAVDFKNRGFSEARVQYRHQTLAVFSVPEDLQEWVEKTTYKTLYIQYR